MKRPNICEFVGRALSQHGTTTPTPSHDTALARWRAAGRGRRVILQTHLNLKRWRQHSFFRRPPWTTEHASFPSFTIRPISFQPQHTTVPRFCLCYWFVIGIDHAFVGDDPLCRYNRFRLKRNFGFASLRFCFFRRHAFQTPQFCFPIAWFSCQFRLQRNIFGFRDISL